MKPDAPTVRLTSERDASGEVYLKYDETFENTDVPELNVLICDAEGDSAGGSHARELTVFFQKAMAYGKYSAYMSKHGCACCALTTMLRGFSERYRGLRPEDTLAKVEKSHLSKVERFINYMRPMLLQMPVTLNAISKILTAEGIANRYIKSFSDREAVAEIETHLLSGRPVMIETSRKRRENGKIVDRNDNKYAGTNHTQILLGMTRDGKAVYADSADRSWTGSRQRLKEADLDDMINYMFPQQRPSNVNYYWGRKRTGGYILIDEVL